MLKIKAYTPNFLEGPVDEYKDWFFGVRRAMHLLFYNTPLYACWSRLTIDQIFKNIFEEYYDINEAEFDDEILKEYVLSLTTRESHEINQHAIRVIAAFEVTDVVKSGYTHKIEDLIPYLPDSPATEGLTELNPEQLVV